MDIAQKQTAETFGFKWGDMKDSLAGDAIREKSYNWMMEKYFSDEKDYMHLMDFLEDKNFLDAGCGNGYSASLLFNKHLKNFNYFGVDIAADALAVAKEQITSFGGNSNFIHDNIQTMNLDQKFDYIFSEGVIHHTSKPFDTFMNLSRHLNDGGIIAFYVYREKAPIREYADDLIREKLKEMSSEQAWEALYPLTNLGIKLGELDGTIEIDEDIELLGIEKGSYTIQRFFYWFFCKMYYDKNISFDNMNHINFDWYMPTNCYRMKPEDVKDWVKKANLELKRFYVDNAGITAIAQKI